jgi:hypothetical protein
MEASSGLSERGYEMRRRLERLAWRNVMKKGHVAAAVLGGLFALGASLIATAQTPSPSPGQAPAGGGLTILEFKPAMDDLMTMLIQPRHLKLYYAGEAKNWKLAEFQLHRPDHPDLPQDRRRRCRRVDLHREGRRRRGGDQGRRSGEVQGRLRRDDRSVQRLPRRDGARVLGDQGAGSQRLSEPGIPALSR